MTDDPAPPASPPYEHLVRRPAYERLVRAKRRLEDVEDVVDPSTKGALGCGVAVVHAATWTLGVSFMVAPCTAGLVLGGVVPAIVAFVVGGVVGWPLFLRASRTVRAALVERVVRGVEQRRLPAGAGGGAATPTAIGVAVQDDHDVD